MKKIGICTLYYNNRNYGANLQAYALQRIVASFGFEAEMLSYYNNTRLHLLLSVLKQRIKKKSNVFANIKIRNDAVDSFKLAIPHSKLYYSSTIRKANAEYDGFIAGSDQVWNPDWINNFMSLAFVDPDQLTVAYAVSTGKITMNQIQKKNLKSLWRTQTISQSEKKNPFQLCKS